MCTTCGCGESAEVTILRPRKTDTLSGNLTLGHHHEAEHHHHHHEKVLHVEQDILQQNDLLAERNRGYFEAKNILAINLVSSPGSGKTA